MKKFILWVNFEIARFIELIRTIINLLIALFIPIHAINDLKEGLRPYKKLVFSNDINNKFNRNNLNVISWNILRNYNYLKINKSLESIMKSDFLDVVFIQEGPVTLSFKFWEYKLFKKYNFSYAPLHQVKKQSLFYNFLQSGQIIFSKYRFNKTKVYELPTVTRLIFCKNHILKRIVLYSQINIGAKTCGLYNLHLENACGPDARKRQIKYLINIINRNNDDFVVIGGDFNTFLGSRFEVCLNLLEQKGFGNLFSKERRIFPRLDYFFVKGARAKGYQLIGRGSDHQPIRAKLEL